MPDFIGSPTRVEMLGNIPRIVEEYFGVINSEDTRLSISHSTSPSGWIGLGQCPDYDEYILVVKGTLTVEYEEGSLDVQAGEAVHCYRHEWVRYSTPGTAGAEYYSICSPSHTRANVHHDS